MKINNLNEKVRDLLKLEGLDGRARGKQIDKINRKIDKIQNQQVPELQHYTFAKKSPQEVIVVFNKVSSKYQCLEDYSKYSHWWSKSQNIPGDMKLLNKFGFKVSEAPEPFEAQIEYNYYPQWKNYLYIILVYLLISGLCIIFIYFPVRAMDSAYDDLTDYKDCIKYDFDFVTIATYTSASSVNTEEKYCYCRHNGWRRVQDDTDINSEESGLKDFCNDWTEDYKYLYAMVAVSFVMMHITNLLITYGFKFLFNEKILKFKKISNKSKLVNSSVFVFTSIFIGIMPGFMIGISHHDMDRIWYLRAGPLYILYMLLNLLMYIIESFSYYLLSKFYTCLKSKKNILQKDLNKLYEGKEYDYSHKFGRLIGHAFVTYFIGPGVPLLYLIYSGHLVIFLMIES